MGALAAADVAVVFATPERMRVGFSGVLDPTTLKTKRARGIRKLDAEALHELRKELKKLRYAADMLASIYPRKRVSAYLKALKALQDGFGSLNDAAMAEDTLTGAGAPAPAGERVPLSRIATVAAMEEGAAGRRAYRRRCRGVSV